MAPNFDFEQRIDYDMQPEYEDAPETEAPQQADDKHDDNFMEQKSECEWVQKHRKLVLPDVELPFKLLMEPKKLSLREQFGKHGLQVIVKLANIELTREKPEYHGGIWHVEGQMVSLAFSFVNTHIMAKS